MRRAPNSRVECAAETVPTAAPGPRARLGATPNSALQRPCPMRHFPGRGWEAPGAEVAPGNWTGRRERVKSSSSFLGLVPASRTSLFLHRGSAGSEDNAEGPAPPPVAACSSAAEPLRPPRSPWAGTGNRGGEWAVGGRGRLGGGADSYQGDRLSPGRSGP